MKTKPPKKSAPVPTPVSKQKVRLHHHAPEAKRVCVAGTFNDWQPDVAPMKLLEDGQWTVELELPPGNYEYRFVLDGCHWHSDPAAAETVLNPFGGYNAVLRVTAPA